MKCGADDVDGQIPHLAYEVGIGTPGSGEPGEHADPLESARPSTEWLRSLAHCPRRRSLC